MMCSNPLLKVVEIAKIPRKPEHLVRLSDGSILLAFKQDLARIGILENTEVTSSTIDELKRCYQQRKAKEVAVRMLKMRPRTEAELRRRFSQLKIDDEIQSSVIEELKSRKLIDDLRFARLWIGERKSKFGMARIARELVAKGIDADTIEEAMSLEYDHQDEVSRIEEILRKRLERLKGLEPEVVKQKMYQYLVRRGFESDLVCEVIRKVID